MDKTVTDAAVAFRMHGFEDQRLCVVPRPQVEAALLRPGTRRLVVTDAGYFPSARGHRRFRPHGSEETIVMLCVAGGGTVHIGDESHILTASTWTSIPARAPHEYRASEDSPWTIWWLHVRGTDSTELAGPMAGAAQQVSRLRSLDRVLALFDELVTLLEGRLSPAHLLAASGVAWNLLTRMSSDTLLPAEGSALERAIRYLESRVDGNIRVSELASMVGVSPSHLTALFRQSTGGGPGAFHTSLKMARARTLLDTTPTSVSQVASAVGYADPLYFSRHFRRIHGVNPSAYRAQRKG
jgi:AraC-like DNA-binding protein/quercetin dioxygenase-like cupin family protein